jgi:hypothetical protein
MALCGLLKNRPGTSALSEWASQFCLFGCSAAYRRGREMMILIGFAQTRQTREKFSGGCVATYGALMNF